MYKRFGVVAAAGLGLLGAGAMGDVLVGTPAGFVRRLTPQTGAYTHIVLSNNLYCGFGWQGGELKGLRYLPRTEGFFCDLTTVNPATGLPTSAVTTSIYSGGREGSTNVLIGMSGASDGTLYGFEYQTVAPWDRTLVSTRGEGDEAFEALGPLGVVGDGSSAGDPLGRIWGVSQGNFYELDRATGAARVVAAIPSSITEALYGMAFDKGVLYVIGTRAGIYAINRGTGEFTRVATYQGGTGISQQVFWAVSEHPLCLGDLNSDGFVDFFDYGAFVDAFEAGTLAADVNADGFIDFFDYSDYVGAFEAGC